MENLTLTALRRRYAVKAQREYEPAYGQAGFGIWLQINLIGIVDEACQRIDAEDRRFTVSEVKRLVKLYVYSKPYAFASLPPERRPKATAASISGWVVALDGYGPSHSLANHRDRLPIEWGIATPQFWENFVVNTGNTQPLALTA